MKRINIGNKYIGKGEPCFIIAEAGSNHNRKFEQALKLIDIASQCTASAVKFQLYSAERLYSKKVSQVKKYRELLAQLELPREWLQDLVAYCNEKNIIFLATPFDLDAVDELESIDIPAYKIASGDITYIPLIEYVAKTCKPIILSTGMARLSEIESALDAIYKHNNDNIVIMHCITHYPAKYSELNLKVIPIMQQMFQLPVGFSDHTQGITADIAAVTLGACVIEKHFTISRKLPGADHSFALEPDELKLMVNAIRDTESALGSPVPATNLFVDNNIRRSIVAKYKIPVGTKITKDMLDVKRPGIGISPALIDMITGREAKCNIDEDEILTWEMI